MFGRLAAAFAAPLLAVILSAPAAAVAPFQPPERATALERVAALIESKYVYKDKAAAIAAELRGLSSDPELAGARDRSTWAAILTRRLDAHDVHFEVSWTAPGPGQPQAAPQAPPSPEARDREMAADNYGFKDVEQLPGNIGYIRLDSFASFDRTLTGDRTPAARRTAEAALRLVGNTDAVIFDLRHNGGGSPDTIDLLLSAFFGDTPVLLNSFYVREGDRKIDFTTLGNYAGPRRPAVPVFVLISGRTASAAEEFAYDVQTQKRGVIVGEVSAGGANPGRSFDAGDGFEVFVSTGAAVNPITRTNWEGVGVKPDVEVPAAEALTRAHTLALEAVLKAKASTSPVEARWSLERLKAEQQGVRLSAREQAGLIGQFGPQQISLDGGNLTLRRDRAPRLRLIPLGGDAFAVEGSPYLRVTFERAADGRAGVLTMAYADGGSASYERKSP